MTASSSFMSVFKIFVKTVVWRAWCIMVVLSVGDVRKSPSFPVCNIVALRQHKPMLTARQSAVNAKGSVIVLVHQQILVHSPVLLAASLVS